MFDSPETSRYLGAKLSLPSIRKPPRLHRGDTVGVIAPAGAVDGARLQAGVRVLEGWGLRVELGDAVLARNFDEEAEIEREAAAEAERLVRKGAPGVRREDLDLRRVEQLVKQRIAQARGFAL